MTTITTGRAAVSISYEPATTSSQDMQSSQELIAEAIGCIISGRPLPAHLRPTVLASSRPTTVQDGIARILAGTSAF